DQILFSDQGPPANEPDNLWQGVRGDPERCRKLLLEITGQWRDGSLAKQNDAAERIEVLNGLLQSDNAGTPSPEFKDLVPMAKDERQLDERLPAPHRAMAMTDGTGWQGHVLIRVNDKNLGEEVPRGLVEALGGVGNAPTSGSGRLDLARRMVQPSNPLLA